MKTEFRFRPFNSKVTTIHEVLNILNEFHQGSREVIQILEFQNVVGILYKVRVEDGETFIDKDRT